MLCWKRLFIVSKRTGSARLFADERSAIVGTISGRNSVGNNRDVLWEDPGMMGTEDDLFASGQRKGGAALGRREDACTRPKRGHV